MTHTCEDKCVGHVMAVSMSLNGLPASMTEQAKVMQRVQEEIKKAQAIKEKEEEEARKLPSTHPSSVEKTIAPGTDNTVPTDPEEKKRALDRSVMCTIMCCCNDHPAKGQSEQDLKQSCAHQVLQAADKALEWKGRYKSELSWNMNLQTGEPPQPMMHRDAWGNDTIEPSHYWQGRIAEVDGYRPGRGDIRRPDLVIVLDSSKPPSHDNIDQVVEFKFGQDKRDPLQDAAYKTIAGNRKKYSIYRVGGLRKDKEQGCNCLNPIQPAT